jgi:hypothetical protein
MVTFHGFKVGDRVKIKTADEAYDGGYIFETDVGTIKSFAPKVRIMKFPPIRDGLSYFAYCEFDRIVDKKHNNHLRGGVDICNLKKAV